MMINESLPAFLVDRLEKDSGPVRGKTVGILGMAFKADIDDPRDALSFKLAKTLRFRGVRVLCSDEYMRDPSFVPKEELLKQAEIVIIGVPHTAYRSLHIPSGKQVVDLWKCLPSR
jgi:UDP-N-acetyl-D-mannosaminuronic acid dehydrogenase